MIVMNSDNQFAKLLLNILKAVNQGVGLVPGMTTLSSIFSVLAINEVSFLVSA